jgi:hypothetical protein
LFCVLFLGCDLNSLFFMLRWLLFLFFLFGYVGLYRVFVMISWCTWLEGVFCLFLLIIYFFFLVLSCSYFPYFRWINLSINQVNRGFKPLSCTFKVLAFISYLTFIYILYLKSLLLVGLRCSIGSTQLLVLAQLKYMVLQLVVPQFMLVGLLC